MSAKLATNDLEAFWMPFTANRQYKRSPRLVVSAERMHFTTADGRRVLDGTSGLWCVNAGHCRPKIVEAIRQQAGELDFAGTRRELPNEFVPWGRRSSKLNGLFNNRPREANVVKRTQGLHPSIFLFRYDRPEFIRHIPGKELNQFNGYERIIACQHKDPAGSCVGKRGVKPS
jgi:hypothetical protein